MEHTWEKFLKTGSVADYLAYRGKDQQKELLKENNYGTVDRVDRDGTKCHADRRL